MFLLHHLDNLLQLSFGVFFTWLGFQQAPAGFRARRLFQICGPALIAIAGLLLFLKPADGATSWQRQRTADGLASAEFPGAPTPKETTDTIGDVTVKRTSFAYDVPGKDIALLLSYSTLPENARTLTDAQRLESTLAYLTSQGGTVTAQETDATGSLHRITVRQAEKKATIRMALAYVGDKVYRVVASWTDGEADDALVERFVRSFAVEGSRAVTFTD